MGDGHVGLGEGGSVVGPVARHGHELALGLLVPDQLELHLWSGLGQEVIHAGLGRDGGGGQGVVARDHHRAQPHGPETREALLDPALHDVLQVHDAQHPPTFRDGERRPSRLRDGGDGLVDLRRHTAPE
jgi:hypothetical protein